MTRLLLLSTACTFALSAPAWAQETPEPVAVDEVVVTATRLPAEVADQPGARVITAEEIERRQAVFASDVLETVPGLSFSQAGAFGGVAAVRIRGAASDKTLVLLDGVPLNDPSQPSGGFDFSSFEVADIERIEILSGPQGSLWGSDAIGGVIAFTTRELDGWRAEAEAGSFATFRGLAAVGRSTAGYAWGLNVSGLTTAGISKADEDDGNPEEDGFQTFTAGANGRVRLSENVQLDGRVRYNDSEAEIDGFPAPDFALADTDERAESRSWSGFGRARIEALGLGHALSLSLYDIERASLGGDFPSAYTADRVLWCWTAERNRPGDRYAFVLGAEREDTEARLSDGSSADLGATAAFGVLRLTPSERLTLTASLRWDDPDRYDAETTARASATYDLGRGFSLSGSYGQGFKTPTISQTACDFCFPAGPSLDLRPERAEGWDARLAWRSTDGRYDAAVTAYRLSVEDQIDYVFDPATFEARYVNIDRTLSRGIEAQASAELANGFSLRGAYAYTDAEDLATGTRLLRVPEHQGSASLLWTGARTSAGLFVRAESDQADAGGEREGFVTADLTGAYRINDRVQLTARIENLFDADYQEVLGYGEPGLSAYVGVRLRR